MGRLCGHWSLAWAWRSSWVMGIGTAFARHGHECHGWLAMGVGLRGAWASVVVVGVPWLRQGEGANGVPIQRNLLNVYPHLEL